MHGIHAVGDDGAFGDEHGGLAVGAAAYWEDGVDHGLAGVGGDDGVEAEGWFCQYKVRICLSR